MVMIRSAGIRATVIALGAVALTLSGFAIPAHAATKDQMRAALLTSAEIDRLVPKNAGKLTDPVVTKRTAQYQDWENVDGGKVSAVGLSIAHVNRGKARPRNLRHPYDLEWVTIRRTKNTLVQSVKGIYVGTAYRVTIFKGRNVVAATCAQVVLYGGESLVPDKTIRACATKVAKAQFDKLQRTVG